MGNSVYQQLLLHPLWVQKRKEILKRDGHQCLNCGSNKSLQVHHRQYHICSRTEIWKKPWQYANHYLITLCNTCHHNGHRQYQICTFRIH